MRITMSYPGWGQTFIAYLGTLYNNVELVETEPDLVIFPGGEDVSPEIYGEKNVASFTNPSRDASEIAVFNEFYGKIPLWGVCRGSQLLNALLGGKLCQDLNGEKRHGNLHPIQVGELSYLVNSTHHQGVIDTPLNVAASYKGTVEIAYNSLVLTTQFHPEYGISYEVDVLIKKALDSILEKECPKLL